MLVVLRRVSPSKRRVMIRIFEDSSSPRAVSRTRLSPNGRNDRLSRSGEVSSRVGPAGVSVSSGLERAKERAARAREREEELICVWLSRDWLRTKPARALQLVLWAARSTS